MYSLVLVQLLPVLAVFAQQIAVAYVFMHPCLLYAKQIAVNEINERAKKLSEALAALSAENQRLAKKRGVKDYAVPANVSEVCYSSSGNHLVCIFMLTFGLLLLNSWRKCSRVRVNETWRILN